MTKHSYTTDRYGWRIYVGDYVECITSQYNSIKKGDLRKVLRITADCFELYNESSLYSSSLYRQDNFILSRKVYKKLEGKKDMFSIAIRITDLTKDQLMSRINAGNFESVHAKAAESESILREWLRQHITTYPDERWIILSGDTVAEISNPPVIFRKV